MHFTSLVALLPALALAQEQAPLADRVQGWFNKAKSFVPTAVPAEPVVKLAEKVSEKRVTKVDLDNWQSLLTPAAEPQDWLIYVTGGNKTCFGRCEHPDKAFNQSVLLFSADPTSPNLGVLDCEVEKILCAAWSAGSPSVHYFKVPQAQPEGEERLPTPLHHVYMNHTTVTAQDFYKIHSEKRFEDSPAYEGFLHPTDGLLAQYNLNIPFGYFIYGVGAIPSWMFMIGISFFSRTIMGRRMNNLQGSRQAPATPAAGSGN